MLSQRRHTGRITPRRIRCHHEMWARTQISLSRPLIVVTADHNHSMSIVGTHDRREEQGRAVNGVYADATYPTYVDTYGDRFPDDPNPEVPLFSAGPTTPTTPTTSRPTRCSPSRRCWTRAGAELQTGNLPFNQTNCVLQPAAGAWPAKEHADDQARC